MSLTSRDLNSESSGVSMDLMSLVRLVARHWRVTVPAAVLTLIMVVAAFVLSSPTYEANASVALFSPPQAPESSDGTSPSDVGQNPFNRYGDLSVVADIVARKMDSDAEHAGLKAHGVSGYTVVANRLQRGPLVDVTGTGSTPEAAISSAKAVVAEFDAVLSELQRAEGADPDYLITSAPIEPPEAAVAQVGSTVRTGIAAMAVGGLGTLGLAVLAEAFTRRRSTRRPADAPQGAGDAVQDARRASDDRPSSPPAGHRPETAPVRASDDRPSSPPAGRRPETAPVRASDDRPSSPPAGRRPGTPPEREPADQHATSPVATSSAATDHADREPVARSNRRNGTRRSTRNGGPVNGAADRAQTQRGEWTRWLPSSETGPEKGQPQRRADGTS